MSKYIVVSRLTVLKFGLVYMAFTGKVTPNQLTPGSSHPIFGQVTLYMKYRRIIL